MTSTTCAEPEFEPQVPTLPGSRRKTAVASLARPERKERRMSGGSHKLNLLAVILLLLMIPLPSESSNGEQKPKGIIVVPVPESKEAYPFHYRRCEEILKAVELAGKENPISSYDIEIKSVSYTYDPRAYRNKENPNPRPGELLWNEIAKLTNPEGPFVRPTDRRYLIAVVGHPYSDEAIYYGELYNSKQVVFITPSATNHRVTKNKDFVFSMTYDDKLQAKYLAHHLKQATRHQEDRCKLVLVASISGKSVTLRWQDPANGRSGNGDPEEIRWKKDLYVTPWETVRRVFIDKLPKNCDLGEIRFVVEASKEGGECETTLNWVDDILRNRYYPLRIVLNQVKNSAQDTRTAIVYPTDNPTSKDAAQMLAKRCGGDSYSWKKFTKLYANESETVESGSKGKPKCQVSRKRGRLRVVLVAPPDDWMEMAKDAIQIGHVTEIATSHFCGNSFQPKRTLLVGTNTSYSLDLTNELKTLLPDEDLIIKSFKQLYPPKCTDGRGQVSRDDECKISPESLADVNRVVLLVHAESILNLVDDLNNATYGRLTIVGPDSFCKPDLLIEARDGK